MTAEAGPRPSGSGIRGEPRAIVVRPVGALLTQVLEGLPTLLATPRRADAVAEWVTGGLRLR